MRSQAVHSTTLLPLLLAAMRRPNLKTTYRHAGRAIPKSPCGNRWRAVWLQKQRVQRKLKPADVATKLGVSEKDVEMIEARKWPLQDEWFPALRELFAPPRGVKAKKPAPMPRKAPAKTTAKTAKAVAKTGKQTAPTPAKATLKPTNTKTQAFTKRRDKKPDSPTARSREDADVGVATQIPADRPSSAPAAYHI